MMVNWFGFAAVCEQPGTPVQGKVDVAPVPAGPAAGRLAQRLLVARRRCRQPPPGRGVRVHPPCLWTGDGQAADVGRGIGCRRSTWTDPEVNAAIPFMRRLDELHARRGNCRAQTWPRLVHVIDAAVQKAIKATNRPAILREAQAQTAGLRL